MTYRNPSFSPALFFEKHRPMNTTCADPDLLPIENAEIDVLAELVPLQAQSLIEIGCGSAQLARGLLQRWPLCQVTALEVDAVQHAKNLASPQPGLHFVAAGAEALPFPDAAFDGALMLKSLHHVPMAGMDAAHDVPQLCRPPD